MAWYTAAGAALAAVILAPMVVDVASLAAWTLGADGEGGMVRFTLVDRRENDWGDEVFADVCMGEPGRHCTMVATVQSKATALIALPRSSETLHVQVMEWNGPHWEPIGPPVALEVRVAKGFTGDAGVGIDPSGNVSGAGRVAPVLATHGGTAGLVWVPVLTLVLLAAFLVASLWRGWSMWPFAAGALLLSLFTAKHPYGSLAPWVLAVAAGIGVLAVADGIRDRPAATPA